MFLAKAGFSRVLKKGASPLVLKCTVEQRCRIASRGKKRRVLKKQFLKGFEKSSACMSQQKGYRLLKEESLSHALSSCASQSPKLGFASILPPPF